MSAVAMFAASSCNKVEINEPQIETPSVNEAVGSLEFVAYTEAETKTTLNGLATEWEAEDGIDVNGFSYTTYESGAKVIFKLEEGYEGEIPEAPYTAGYPSSLVYNNYNSEPDCAGTLNFDFSNEHTLTAGEICDDVLAIAYSESDMSLHFKNVVSLIKFRVPAVAEDITEIKISANEPLAGKIAVNYNDGKPTWAIDGDESFNELVLTPSSDNFVAGDDIYYYAPVLPGQKTNLTFKINDKVVATGISMELKRNVIHYIATLPAAPKWAIAGTFNGWSTTANPMVKEGDYYVARNITGLHFTAQDGKEESATGFKFVQNGNVWKGSGENGGVMTVGSWSWIWGDNGSHICVDGAVAETAYDIYLDSSQGDHGKFVIVAAGDAMPEDKPAEEPEVVVGYWAVTGTMNGWADYAKLTLDGDWHVATEVKLTVADQFKLRADGDWGVNRGAAEGEDGVVIENNVETAVVKDGKNFSVAENGMYSVYINKAATKVKVVRTGDIPLPSVKNWGIVGSITEWGTDPDIPMTLNGDWYIASGVEMPAGTTFKFRVDGKWASAGGKELTYSGSVVSGTEYNVGAGSSNISVISGAIYDVYLSYDETKMKVVKVGDLPDPDIMAKEGYVYLLPNSNWTQANARFAIYLCNGSKAAKWISMTKVEGTSYYEVQLPSDFSIQNYKNIIFVRMNPSTSANNWNNGVKWNQTSDLDCNEITTKGQNCYSIKAGTWDKGGGTWSNVTKLN